MFHRINGDIASRVMIIIGFCAGHVVVDAFMLRPLLMDGGRNGRIAFGVILPFWVFFNVIWMWSYIATCWLDAGSVQRELKKYKNGQLPPEIDALPRCEKCGLPKPIRTHHCGRCGKCYFRFDHHCPIIGNCVAFANTKPFMLFLFYSGAMLLMLAVISTAGCFIACIIPGPIQGAIAAIGTVFAIVVISFGSTFVAEVCSNRTTLEKIAGFDSQAFAATRKENLDQMFGKHCIEWFLPTRPSVSGFVSSGVGITEHLV